MQPEKASIDQFNAIATLKVLAKDPLSLLSLSQKELEILSQFDISQDIGVPYSILKILV